MKGEWAMSGVVSESQRPLISVVIPVYNAGDYLRPCLDSIRSQTLESFEAICVDDGSSDASLAVLREYAEMDGRFRVYGRENHGAAATRNFALERAAGEFLFFIDSDDYIPAPTALERLYQAARENAVEIAGGSMCFDRHGEMDYESMHGVDLDRFDAEEVVSYQDYQYDYDFTRFIYAREMVERESLRFPERSQFEDPVFHVHAMLAAGRFATIPDFVYAYRRFDDDREKPASWSETQVLDRLAGIEDLLTLSAKEGLAKLHSYVVEQLEKETTCVFLDHSGSDRVMAELYRANSAIDCALLSQAREDFEGEAYVIEPLDIVNDGYRKYRRLRETFVGKALARVRRLVAG